MLVGFTTSQWCFTTFWGSLPRVLVFIYADCLFFMLQVPTGGVKKSVSKFETLRKSHSLISLNHIPSAEEALLSNYRIDNEVEDEHQRKECRKHCSLANEQF